MLTSNIANLKHNIASLEQSLVAHKEQLTLALQANRQRARTFIKEFEESARARIYKWDERKQEFVRKHDVYPMSIRLDSVMFSYREVSRTNAFADRVLFTIDENSEIEHIGENQWLDPEFMLFSLSPKEDKLFEFALTDDLPTKHYEITRYICGIERRNVHFKPSIIEDFAKLPSLKIKANSFDEASAKAIKKGLLTHLHQGPVKITHTNGNIQFQYFFVDPQDQRQEMEFSGKRAVVDADEIVMSERLKLLELIGNSISEAEKNADMFRISINTLMNEVNSGRITYVWDDQKRSARLFRFRDKSFKKTNCYAQYSKWLKEAKCLVQH